MYSPHNDHLSNLTLPPPALDYTNKRPTESTCSFCNCSKPSTHNLASYVYLVKQQQKFDSHDTVVGIYARLEDANDKAYAMWLDYETRHSCFSYYGEDSNHGCLSWEVSGEGEEIGLKVFVERVEVVGRRQVEERRDWRSV